MLVPTIRNYSLDTEEDFRRMLEKEKHELQELRRKSNPLIRTAELWNRFYQLQANVAWIEESLAKMKPAKEPKLPRTVRNKRRRPEDED